MTQSPIEKAKEALGKIIGESEASIYLNTEQELRFELSIIEELAREALKALEGE